MVASSGRGPDQCDSDGALVLYTEDEGNGKASPPPATGALPADLPRPLPACSPSPAPGEDAASCSASARDREELVMAGHPSAVGVRMEAPEVTTEDKGTRETGVAYVKWKAYSFATEPVLYRLEWQMYLMGQWTPLETTPAACRITTLGVKKGKLPDGVLVRFRVQPISANTGRALALPSDLGGTRTLAEIDLESPDSSDTPADVWFEKSRARRRDPLRTHGKEAEDEVHLYPDELRDDDDGHDFSPREGGGGDDDDHGSKISDDDDNDGCEVGGSSGGGGDDGSDEERPTLPGGADDDREHAVLLLADDDCSEQASPAPLSAFPMELELLSKATANDRRLNPGHSPGSIVPRPKSAVDLVGPPAAPPARNPRGQARRGALPGAEVIDLT